MIKLTEAEKSKIQAKLEQAVRMLSQGAQKVEFGIPGNKSMISITGYWVDDVIRIDIKL